MDATKIEIAPKSLDGVFTDPPYFGMVQYGELMEFCFVWLKKLMEKSSYCIEARSSIHQDELTGNHSAERDIYHFFAGLSEVFRKMALALKPGAPLVFTYHHNQQDAYVAIGVAILNAGLNCSASLPCPAEMSGSIHIHGTSSSIIDTVFVCREHGKAPKKLLFSDADGLISIVATELADLSAAGLKATNGDLRCIVLGHITRMAIWNLRRAWNLESSTISQFTEFQAMMNSIAMVGEVTERLSSLPLRPSGLIFDYMEKGNRSDAVAF